MASDTIYTREPFKAPRSGFGALFDDERAELGRLLLRLIEGRGFLAEHLADEAHD